MKIIIPARLGSKGLPFKNRELFEYTAQSIPEEHIQNTWVTTDDPMLQEKAREFGFNVIDRPSDLAQDETSTRDVLVHAISKIGIQPDEMIVMLYLTYPQRTWQDIYDALLFFVDHAQSGRAGSMLCKKEPKTNPFLCLQEHGVDGLYGRQLVHHDLYRRQDYPKFFEISHYVCILFAREIHNLNKNLYCDSTIFYPITEAIDVDTQKELDEFNGR